MAANRIIGVEVAVSTSNLTGNFRVLRGDRIYCSGFWTFPIPLHNFQEFVFQAFIQ